MINDLLFITIITVYIIDLSGFVNEMKMKAYHLLFRKKEYQPFSLKPFDCSLCVTWWVGIIYLYLNDSINLSNITVLSMLSFNADLIKDILIGIKDGIGATLNKLYNIMNNENN